MTFHNGQYKFSCGYWISKRTGRRCPRVWMLGADKAEAEHRAGFIKGEWDALQRCPLTKTRIWPANALERIDAFLGGQFQRDCELALMEAGMEAVRKNLVKLNLLPSEKPPPLTVKQTAARFIQHLQERADATTISKAHLASQKCRLSRALEANTENAADRPAIPLRDLAMDSLCESNVRAAILWIVKRPTFKRPRGKGKEVQIVRMSRSYASACLDSLKWFLEWAHKRDYWNAPKTFDELWSDGPVLTEEEKQRQLEDASGVEPPTFSLEELCHLYVNSSPHLRAYILFGLNCGADNAWIASLRRYEVKELDSPRPFIERLRQKSRRSKKSNNPVYAKWFLWPETAQALRGLMNEAAQFPAGKDRTHGLCAVSLNGKPLAEDTKYGRKDAISQAWRRLHASLTFKYLRKTSAKLIRTAVGLGNATELADMLLSHSDRGIIKHYSGRDWNALANATDKLRVQLQPMFDAAARADSDLSVPHTPQTGFRNPAPPAVMTLVANTPHNPVTA